MFKAHVADVLEQHFARIVRREDCTPPEYNQAIRTASEKAYSQIHRHIRRKEADLPTREEMRRYAAQAVEKKGFSMYVMPVKKNKRYKGM